MPVHRSSFRAGDEALDIRLVLYEKENGEHRDEHRKLALAQATREAAV